MLDKRLLLHICCAPCLIYPLERLKANGFKVTGFFYNPNIHPLSEYQFRKQALEKLTSSIEIIYPQYYPEEFFKKINLKEEKPQRCSICCGLRLKRTAQASKEKNYSHFSTTLLVSPYQDQALLKQIGEGIAKDEGINFYYEDFRGGFKKAHAQAKAQGIYCQNYCGCIYSHSNPDDTSGLRAH